MELFLLGIVVLAGSGVLSACLGTRAKPALWVSALGVIAGAVLGLIPAAAVLAGGEVPALRAEWSVPFGEFAVAIDPLSAVFLLPVFGVGAIAALYSTESMADPEAGRVGLAGLFFNLFVASLALLVVARNGILFLAAWEVMSLSSFFLVCHDDTKPENREAGWTYLVASHIGAGFLFALFVLLGREYGTMDFDAFTPAAGSALLFVLALIGFGTKAGLVPLHVWLPQAYPAAPNHVTALLSGAASKVGLYGILRVIIFLGIPEPWWGGLMVTVGALTGLGGIVFALAQHDYKRMLAYSSIENMGIMTLSVGVGLLGMSYGSAAVAVLGFAGALLHMLNHSLFKSLLFLGAGAVAQATGTRRMDRLGGLLKRMPRTGVLVLVGAAAASALPPFNGFVGEFLVYLGAFEGASALPVSADIPLVAVIGSLALIGGLAAATMIRGFGIVFLGEPRTDDARTAREPGPAMTAAMALPAIGCLAVGLCPFLLFKSVGLAVAEILFGHMPGVSAGAVPSELDAAVDPLIRIGSISAAVIVVFGGLAFLRSRLLAGRPIGETGTWGCGYLAPKTTMQYTSSSFAQPLTDLFEPVLGTRRNLVRPQGLFPARASLDTHTPDGAAEYFWAPLFRAGASVVKWIRPLQSGRIQVYVLYIAATLMALLVYHLG